MSIIIGQAGWVWVGHYERNGDTILIRDARCIRRWGTTRGLAQLANDGPQPETKLEPACDVELHVLAVIGRLPCREEAWR